MFVLSFSLIFSRSFNFDLVGLFQLLTIVKCRLRLNCEMYFSSLTSLVSKSVKTNYILDQICPSNGFSAKVKALINILSYLRNFYALFIRSFNSNWIRIKCESNSLIAFTHSSFINSNWFELAKSHYPIRFRNAFLLIRIIS